MGPLIVFEGIDQSGKKSQARLLVGRLERSGLKTESLSFPVYSTPIGREIKAFLKNKRNYPAQVQHMLLAANRWEMKDQIESWLHKGLAVILNRYSYSNYAYGISKGLNPNWLKSLDRGLPEPDIVFLLDVSPDASWARKTRGRDLHEKDLQLLTKVRENYIRLASQHDWIIINGEMTVENVHQKVSELVSSRLHERNLQHP
jgi:dTMP kinase